MTTKFKVGDSVTLIRLVGHDAEEGLAVGEVHRIIKIEGSDWVYFAATGSHHPIRPNQCRLVSSTYTLTDSDGTKHNAVGLSAVLGALDDALGNWLMNSDDTAPNVIAKRTIRKLLGYEVDSDET